MGSPCTPKRSVFFSPTGPSNLGIGEITTEPVDPIRPGDRADRRNAWCHRGDGPHGVRGRSTRNTGAVQTVSPSFVGQFESEDPCFSLVNPSFLQSGSKQSVLSLVFQWPPTSRSVSRSASFPPTVAPAPGRKGERQKGWPESICLNGAPPKPNSKTLNAYNPPKYLRKWDMTP